MYFDPFSRFEMINEIMNFGLVEFCIHTAVFQNNLHLNIWFVFLRNSDSQRRLKVLYFVSVESDTFLKKNPPPSVYDIRPLESEVVI